ncbi:hypothetical protein OBBRIDRAFT_792176 [Obba rivulosa]|uniref:Uncharacterized protein n=1 Tax=Obba rivulosa TaxID=1052685 RepID=A0A8E2AV48_9APHY|nr:hypothetical protein OBBRIDRAFT_792176 [Obba rivulosa]
MWRRDTLYSPPRSHPSPVHAPLPSRSALHTFREPLPPRTPQTTRNNATTEKVANQRDDAGGARLAMRGSAMRRRVAAVPMARLVYNGYVCDVCEGRKLDESTRWIQDVVCTIR